jgi:hypothetical protein
VITQYWSAEKKVEHTLDEGRFNSLHVGLMLLGQQSGTRDKTGMVRLELPAVDIAGGSDELPLMPDLENAGLSFNFPVDYAGESGGFGTLATYDETHDGFVPVSLVA